MKKSEVKNADKSKSSNFIRFVTLRGDVVELVDGSYHLELNEDNSKYLLYHCESEQVICDMIKILPLSRGNIQELVDSSCRLTLDEDGKYFVLKRQNNTITGDVIERMFQLIEARRKVLLREEDAWTPPREELELYVCSVG